MMKTKIKQYRHKKALNIEHNIIPTVQHKLIGTTAIGLFITLAALNFKLTGFAIFAAGLLAGYVLTFAVTEVTARHTAKKYKYGKHLPLAVVEEQVWNNIYDAFFILRKLSINSKQRDAVESLIENLFETNVETDLDDPDVQRDMEASYIWTNKFTRPEMLERIAFLLNIRTPQEIKSFSQMKWSIGNEFMEPFEEMSEYVTKINNDLNYFHDELDTYGATSLQQQNSNDMERTLGRIIRKEALFENKEGET